MPGAVTARQHLTERKTTGGKKGNTMQFLHIDEVREIEPVAGYHGRFVHARTMSLAYWRIEAAAEMPEHAHHHEQVVNMMEGEFELVVGGEKLHLRPGSVVVIPPDVPHSGRALSACRIVDAFHPVRDDYRQKAGNE
jgi:quercetin dioxygenase-like cupin family protein